MGFKVVHNIGSLFHAQEILKEHGVKWNQIYRILMSTRRTLFGKYDWVDDWGTPYETGIHLYFNDGEDRNVAWYTEITNTLCFYTDGKYRLDGIPSNQRVYS